jgi:adenine-specific DNA-methyltransferase
MITPRLIWPGELLREDGVMFISIDDREADNLKLLCREVFGEKKTWRR